MEAQAVVQKRDETCIQVNLRRSAIGLMVNVKALPRVEDFVRSLGSGETVDVRTLGRHWVPNKEQVLAVYAMATNPGSLTTDSGLRFRIDRPGWPLSEYDANSLTAGEVINLSFLRLAGISEGDGVTFGVKGVFTMEALNRLRDGIGDASRRFYISYMKPINLTVMVCTQEMS